MSKVYYRGTVVAIISSDASFDIEFDDGDINEALERRCLRPFRPYQVGEEVQVRQSQDNDKVVWVTGIISEVYSDEEDESLSFDVTVDGVILTEIHSEELRRLDSTSFRPGSRVAVYDEQEEYWYPAKVVLANSDGTYVVRDMDGGVEAKVPPHRIRR